MTRLLVSVRDASEAALAVAASVDLIDVKEPDRGSLGAATTETIASVVGEVRGQRPISAALGELTQFDPAHAARLPRELEFAKLGLAQCRSTTDWRSRWQAAAACLPEGIGLVAVVYADATSAAPPADEILAQAIALGCRAVLVDTFDKRAGDLLAHWNLGRVEDWVTRVRQQGMWCVLAGSLTRESIVSLLPSEPDFVAVRGAACRGARNGPIDGSRLAELVELVRHKSTGLARSIPS